MQVILAGVSTHTHTGTHPCHSHAQHSESHLLWTTCSIPWMHIKIPQRHFLINYVDAQPKSQAN